MTTVFLVKYIGLDKLTNSFGLLSMIKGIATMAGPPIAGQKCNRSTLLLLLRFQLVLNSASEVIISSGDWLKTDFFGIV